jgi:hypothetical protein
VVERSRGRAGFARKVGTLCRAILRLLSLRRRTATHIDKAPQDPLSTNLTGLYASNTCSFRRVTAQRLPSHQSITRRGSGELRGSVTGRCTAIRSITSRHCSHGLTKQTFLAPAARPRPVSWQQDAPRLWAWQRLLCEGPQRDAAQVREEGMWTHLAGRMSPLIGH